MIMLHAGYHHWLKRDLKRYSSVAEVMHHLKARDRKKIRDDHLIAMKRRNIEGSSFQQKFNKSHKIKPEDGYEIRQEGETFVVSAPIEEGEIGQREYVLSPNPLSGKDKLVTHFFVNNTFFK